MPAKKILTGERGIRTIGDPEGDQRAHLLEVPLLQVRRRLFRGRPLAVGLPQCTLQGGDLDGSIETVDPLGAKQGPGCAEPWTRKQKSKTGGRER